MLEIKDMSKEDKLFHFMNGLQLGMQSDLQWKNVQTLGVAITTTDKLLDYKEKAEGGPRNGEDAQV
jgi:hypothetical protein